MDAKLVGKTCFEILPDRFVERNRIPQGWQDMHIFTIRWPYWYWIDRYKKKIRQNLYKLNHQHRKRRIEMAVQKTTIAVIGIGYVGLSVSILLARSNTVYAMDQNFEKIQNLNQRISPVQDLYAEKFLKEEKLDLTGTIHLENAIKNASIHLFVCLRIMINQLSALIHQS